MNDIEIFKKYAENYNSGLFVFMLNFNNSQGITIENTISSETIVTSVGIPANKYINDIVRNRTKTLLVVIYTDWNIKFHSNELFRNASLIVTSENTCLKNRWKTVGDYENFRNKYKLVDKLRS